MRQLDPKPRLLDAAEGDMRRHGGMLVDPGGAGLHSGRNRSGMADLMVELDVFKHVPEFPGQNVFIFLNGLRIGSFFVTHRRILIMNFPVNTLRSKNNVLTLDTPDAVPAKNYGLNDTRLLGASVFAVYFRREH